MQRILRVGAADGATKKLESVTARLDFLSYTVCRSRRAQQRLWWLVQQNKNGKIIPLETDVEPKEVKEK